MNDQTLEELLDDWKEERISAKQAIDQILRHLILIYERMRALERGLSPRPPPVQTPVSARRAVKRR